MDVLSSTSASSLKPITAAGTTTFFPAKDHLSLLKRSQLPPPPFNLSTTRPTSPRFSRRHHLHLSSPPRIRPQQLRRPPPPNPPPPPIHVHVYRKASAGYAAALLEAARREGPLAVVERDACRLMRVVRGLLGDASAAEVYKGEVVRRVAEGGGFCKPLVRMVRMLVEKGKVRLVGEVMDEFQRIVDELSGTPVLLVSSATKVGPGELRGIASEVGRATGAAKVKVKHFYAV